MIVGAKKLQYSFLAPLTLTLLEAFIISDVSHVKGLGTQKEYQKKGTKRK